MTTTRRLVSIAEAAKHFDVNPKTIRRWIDAETLPAYLVGPRVIRIDIDEAERVLLRPPRVDGVSMGV